MMFTVQVSQKTSKRRKPDRMERVGKCGWDYGRLYGDVCREFMAYALLFLIEECFEP